MPAVVLLAANRISSPLVLMAFQIEAYDSSPPERFVVEVFSELTQEVVQNHWRELNVILRLSMLSGLQMQLEATLNLLCDFAQEIVSYDRALELNPVDSELIQARSALLQQNDEPLFAKQANLRDVLYKYKVT